MRLVIGGRAQGKLKYILYDTKLSVDNVAFCQTEDIGLVFSKQIIYDLHELVRRLLKYGIEPQNFILKNISEHHIIICDEVGSGVVPMDKLEREYRDAVGDTCCKIAESAKVVERVCCGIPIKIKG